MKKKTVKVLSMGLSLLLLFTFTVQALAGAVVLSDENKRAECTRFINESLNRMKTDKPYAVMTYAGGVPEGKMSIVNEDGEEEMDETAVNYIMPLLDGLFNGNSSITKSFIQTLFGEGNVRIGETVLRRNMSRKNLIPLYGEDYVSNLNPEDLYTIAAEYYEGTDIPSAVKVMFRDYTLADAKESAVADMFSLPNGDIDPVIISGTNKKTETFLSDVRLTEFNIKGAFVQTTFDEKGNVSHYRSQITYDFAISYLDAIKLISAIFGYDLYQAFINTYSTIARNLGKSEDEIEKVLDEYKIKIQYTAIIDLTDFNWEPRYYGDVNDDNKLTASDARLALRHAVGLEPITDAYDLMSADVNFDGEVDAADARLIMRMAVGLDEPFTEVPEGKKIIIVDFSDTEEEEDEPEEEPQEIAEFNGLLDGKFDPSVKLSDIADFVFKVINGVEDAEGEAMENIQDLIDIIRGIVTDSRENNER